VWTHRSPALQTGLAAPGGSEGLLSCTGTELHDDSRRPAPPTARNHTVSNPRLDLSMAFTMSLFLLPAAGVLFTRCQLPPASCLLLKSLDAMRQARCAIAPAASCQLPPAPQGRTGRKCITPRSASIVTWKLRRKLCPKSPPMDGGAPGRVATCASTSATPAPFSSGT